MEISFISRYVRLCLLCSRQPFIIGRFLINFSKFPGKVQVTATFQTKRLEAAMAFDIGGDTRIIAIIRIIIVILIHLIMNCMIMMTVTLVIIVSLFHDADRCAGPPGGSTSNGFAALRGSLQPGICKNFTTIVIIIISNMISIIINSNSSII